MSVYTRNTKLGKKSFSKKHSGFTLIEVLIGVFISAVGIIGILEIQKHVMRSGNEVNARIIAMQLVREKLDHINNIDAFEDVTPPVSPAPTSDEINKKNYIFTRSWQMTTHHFDKDAGTWGAVGAGESTDAKHVVVSVTWTDINNENQVVNGEQIIARASIHDTSGLSSGAGGVRAEPNIPFNQSSTIENPPINLVDDVDAYPDYNTKEPSKPVPTVDAQNGQNLIQFETITYDTDSDKQTLDDFVTVNCTCSFNGSDEAKAPTILTLSDDEESLINDKDSGETITKTVGTVSSSHQPALCTACCEDHHDSDLSSAKYVAGTNGNHPHYSAILGTSIISGDYVEACRFRRVEGFYEMVPDWQLADIITMPKSYFYDNANVSTYVDYVKAVVKAKIMGSVMPEKPDVAARNMIDLVTGTYQLIARGIYVDLASLSSTDLTTIRSYVSGADYKPNWLEYVPFYEINLSLFADWATDPNPSSVATITNEDISTIVDPSTNYYGTYSRGWLTALATGNTDVIAVARTDNTGITGSGAIIPQENTVTDTINAIVNADAGEICEGECKNILREVGCFKYRNNGTRTTCTGQEGQTVNLTYSAGLTCTTEGIVTFPTYSYPNVICNGIRSTWSSGLILLSSPGFKFYFPPTAENPTPAEIATAEASAQTELTVDIRIGADEINFTGSVNMLKQ